MRKNVLLLAILLLITSSGFAQKRYAILFGGEHRADNDIPLLYSKSYDFDQQEAIWNDTYLMWELLLKNGFNNDYIKVIYHTGQDYVQQDDQNNLAPRYYPTLEHSDLYPNPTNDLTEMSSTKENLNSAIQDLYNVITEDDYLVLLVITHGQVNHFQCNGYNSSNPETFVTADELSIWLAPINCKKLILMQQCFGGSFIDELSNNNTIVMTATNEESLATVADKEYHYFNPNTGQFDYSVTYNASVEFESSYSNNMHNHPHSEWFLHLYSALSGEMPDYNY